MRPAPTARSRGRGRAGGHRPQGRPRARSRPTTRLPRRPGWRRSRRAATPSTPPAPRRWRWASCTPSRPASAAAVRARLPRQGQERPHALDFAGARAGRDHDRRLPEGRPAWCPSYRSAAAWPSRFPARCAGWARWCGAGARCRSGAASSRRRSWRRVASRSRRGWRGSLAALDTPRAAAGRQSLIENSRRSSRPSRCARGRHLAPPRSGAGRSASCAPVPTPSTRARSRRRSSTAVRAAGGVMTAEDLAALRDRRPHADRDRLPRAARAVDAAAVVGRHRADRGAGHPGGALSVGPGGGGEPRGERRAASRAGRGVQARASPTARATWATPTSSRSTWRTWPSPALSRRAGRAASSRARCCRATRTGRWGPAARRARTAGPRTCR